jgi:hypothetical protein
VCNCEPNYAGYVCSACPGGVDPVCSGHGYCLPDSSTHDATCFCDVEWDLGPSKSCDVKKGASVTLSSAAIAGICLGLVLIISLISYFMWIRNTDADNGDKVKM